jgi:hypothetical protein
VRARHFPSDLLSIRTITYVRDEGDRRGVRAQVADVAHNLVMSRSMTRSRSVETTVGPLAFDGRTITLVASTRAMHLGDDGRGALHVRSRPRHVEVLDEDGRRQIVAVRDVERMLVAAICIAGIVTAFAVRTIRARTK